MSALAQPPPLFPCGHTINFENPTIFAQKIADDKKNPETMISEGLKLSFNLLTAFLLIIRAA